MTKSQKKRIVAVARYVILTAWAVIVAFPLYWTVSTSFKPSEQWFAWPPVYFTDPLTLDNYLNVWGGLQEYASTVYATSLQRPWIALGNSILISFSATTLAVLYGAVIAYGVSRYKVLSDVRMFQLLMLRMIPPIVI